MRNFLSQKWWVLFFRGSFSVIFGILAIFFPAITLTSLVLLFGVYAIVDGAFGIYHALQNRAQNTNWGWNLLEGIVSIIVGLAAWVLTPLVGVSLLFVISIYAILTGLTQVVAAWRLREIVTHEWLLGFASMISIIFGTLVWIFPLSGAVAIAMLIGVYSIAFGLVLMGAALRYRELQHDWTDDDFGRLDKTEPLPSSW